MERNERGPRQRPPLALYRPPHQRSGQRNDGTMSSHQPQRRMDQQQGIDQQQQGIDQQQQGIDQQQQTLLYQLEVELRPDFWRKVTVVVSEMKLLSVCIKISYSVVSVGKTCVEGYYCTVEMGSVRPQVCYQV